jgi:photosystem II stability/assembly factor-like uncharacterized protein
MQTVRNVLVGTLLITTLSGGAISSAQAWKVTNVAIGAGGWTCHVAVHPTTADLVYSRTDVGGVFRWNPTNSRWIPLNDSWDVWNGNDFGCEAIALDRTNSNLVYIATGSYPYEPGRIWRSANRGDSWTEITPAGLTLANHASGEYRWTGERLAVSRNGSVLLYGSRDNGLFRRDNATGNWTQQFIGTNTADIGITSVTFDTMSDNVAYASVHGDGVYISQDAGLSWARLGYSPVKVQRLVMAPNGTLWCSHEQGVSMFDRLSNYGTDRYWWWYDRTPPSSLSSFCGLAVNPANSNDILTSTGPWFNTELYRLSNPTGNAWQQLNWSYTHSVPWVANEADPASKFTPYWSSLSFDPFNAGRVWGTCWFFTLRCNNINTSAPVFTNPSAGLEDVVTLSLVENPGTGDLFSGHADVDGFRHTSITSMPIRALSRETTGLPAWNYNLDFEVYRADSTRMARLGYNDGGDGGLAVSTNSGASWSVVKTWQYYKAPGEKTPYENHPLRLAMSSNDSGNMVVTRTKRVPQVTLNNGASWQDVVGAPVAWENAFWPGDMVAADPANGAVFYCHDVDNSRILRSTDRGRNFGIWATGINVQGSGGPDSVMRCPPWSTNEVWVGLGWNGLAKVVNGTVSAVPGVTECRLLAFGQVGTTRNIFVYGSVNWVDGIWRSTDNGNTWQNIRNATSKIGCLPMVMEASNRANRVYLGTTGRGVFRMNP